MAFHKITAISTLVLRILTLLSSIACIVMLVTDQVKFGDGSKTTFKDVIAYRYVLSTAVVGVTYSLVQLPFALYYAFKQKRLIRGELLPEFDFYGDKVVSLFLGTGVGAGFAVTFEFKDFLKDLFKTLADSGVVDAGELKSKLDKFLDRGNIATGLLFVAFICMALLSVLSSINKRTTTTGIFG
ncbi:hypothetical protein Dsin_004504 [Dipteronia sinensis]|uniref:CASP-like protein n=1 Tax=Dipteronia sinensis TaxID=43782 RepID=A0AAE0AV32_9ROSI|nr:hypothetical protein Dsin_004504 [Dipteronia sinensis]